MRLTDKEKEMLEYKAMTEQEKTQQANEVLQNLQQKQPVRYVKHGK